MEIPQEIRDLLAEFLSGKTVMLGWPWSIPQKEKVTEKSLLGKNVHTRPCPVCEGKKHGIDSCSRVKSVSYDDAGIITVVEFEAAAQEPSKA